MKKPASFQIVTAISAGSAVEELPSPIDAAKPESTADLIEQAVVGRIEEQPDIGGRDHGQDGRGEEGEPQRRTTLDTAIDPERHRERERNRDRYGDQRVKQVIPKGPPEDRISQHGAVLIEPRQKTAGPPSMRCREEAVDNGRDGRHMGETRPTERRQGRPGSQPCRWMFSCARFRFRHVRRSAPAGSLAPAGAYPSVLIA